MNAPIRYGSLCSGVEAATLAWEPLGWRPVFFSEVEPFPSAVLATRFPKVPNLGDMTKIEGEKYHGTVDLLVGGTPCQDVSVAGKRKGFAGERSGLAFSYIRLLETMRPRWFVWENVPGVLSSNYGEDFKAFIRSIDEIGYSCAWRVLDAQFTRVDGFPRAVPQRRRRVFVVGHLGADWRYPASVLFEPDCLPRNTPPRRIKGKGFASDIERRSGGTGGRPWDASGVNPTLNQCNAGSGIIGASNQELFSQNANGLVMDAKFWNGEDVSTTLTEAFADDRMPDKGKLPCVITESGKGFYSESAVGQTLEAHEDQHRRNIICAGFCQGASPAAGSIGYHEQVSPTIKAGESGTAQVPALLCVHGSQDPIVNSDHANAIGRNQGAENCVCQYGDVAGSLTARYDSSPCADRGMNVLCYENHMQDSRVKPCGECSPQINAKAGTGGGNLPIVQAVAIAENIIGRNVENGGNEVGAKEDVAYTQNCTGVMGVSQNETVRRLTPVECERLMGFPDNWTRIPWKLYQECVRKGWSFESELEKRGKKLKTTVDDCPDSPRYKACGNSMCVNVMRWIGMRIELVERKTKS